jgi:hypothetical protein
MTKEWKAEAKRIASKLAALEVLPHGTLSDFSHFAVAKFIREFQTFERMVYEDQLRQKENEEKEMRRKIERQIFESIRQQQPPRPPIPIPPSPATAKEDTRSGNLVFSIFLNP